MPPEIGLSTTTVTIFCDWYEIVATIVHDPQFPISKLVRVWTQLISIDYKNTRALSPLCIDIISWRKKFYVRSTYMFAQQQPKHDILRWLRCKLFWLGLEIRTGSIVDAKVLPCADIRLWRRCLLTWHSVTCLQPCICIHLLKRVSCVKDVHIGALQVCSRGYK